MCGGRGTRLDADCEKPLFEVGGRPMVDRVVDALAASRIDAVRAVTSPHTPETREHVDCPVLDAPGDGYVADLQYALDRVDAPVLTVAADLPLLAGNAVDRVLDAFDGDSLTVCVPAELKRRLGASADTTFDGDDRELAPTGVNVVADAGDETLVAFDARLTVNVNRQSDAALAGALLPR
jgi:adenosylcobinamide-phosphate guanylyltransferase